MTDSGQAERDNNISFVVGRGNQSSICGAITPMVVVDADQSHTDAPSDEPQATERSS